MAGNVWEWTDTADTMPTRALVTGGHYQNGNGSTESAFHTYNHPMVGRANTSSTGGFRCARLDVKRATGESCRANVDCVSNRCSPDLTCDPPNNCGSPIQTQTVTFTLPDDTNNTTLNDTANKDCINAAVCLTRGTISIDQPPTGSNYGGALFNIVTESYYDSSSHTSPADTEWAIGQTGNLASINYELANSLASTGYTTLRDALHRLASGLNGSSSKPSLINDGYRGTNYMSLHIISTDEYWDIEFHDWQQQVGNGFSYTRTGPFDVYGDPKCDDGGGGES
jgi:hypothetical protein